MPELRILRNRLSRWLVAVLLSAAAPEPLTAALPFPESATLGAVLPIVLTGRQKETGPFSAPRPTPASRTSLAAAFTKPVPASIADLKAIEQHVKALVARVSPAVVAVEVGYGSGSGVIISEDGLVLTAGHVCGAANREVRFTFPDGKTAQGRTLGVEHDSDTGLMRITDRGRWPHAAVGDLQHGENGDWVLALGHPGGFDRQRSLVVRLGRIIQLGPDALQTDCTISPGDSGGPLFDMSGRVIGIHSAISGSLAANYHVPITQFFDTWAVLAGSAVMAGQPPAIPAYLGATGVDNPAGCTVTSVAKNSPASKAGLQVGDVVLRVEEREVKVSASLRRWVEESRPGETLKLEIKRGGLFRTLSVRLEEPPRNK